MIIPCSRVKLENYFFLNFLAITGFRAIIANTAQKEAQLYL